MVPYLYGAKKDTYQDRQFPITNLIEYEIEFNLVWEHTKGEAFEIDEVIYYADPRISARDRTVISK